MPSKNSVFILCLIFLNLLFVIEAQTSKKTARVTFHKNIYLTAEIANTPEKMIKGLGFRENLEDNTGMLFLYPNVGERIFWMKNMQFMIDIIWLREKQIIHIETNVLPPSLLLKDEKIPTYGHKVLADTVLETPAGFTKKHHVKIGEFVEIETE